MTRALLGILDAPDRYRADCAAVEAVFGDRRTPSQAVAGMLAPWLGRSHARPS
jgi:hypothetical protein